MKKLMAAISLSALVAPGVAAQNAPTKAPDKLWSFALNLTKDSSQGVFEYACHEGNYAMKNILSAARAEEQKGR